MIFISRFFQPVLAVIGSFLVLSACAGDENGKTTSTDKDAAATQMYNEQMRQIETNQQLRKNIPRPRFR